MSFLSDIPYIKAFWYITPNPGTRIINWVVIHSAETFETDTTAESLGNYFASNPRILSGERKASTHYGVDNNSIVHYVLDHLICYGAGGANLNGIHIEHAGFAGQSKEEWLDPYGVAMLKLSAQLTAELCRTYGIPMKYVDWQGLRNGERGITTHWDVTLAFKQDDHTDPGLNFPMGQYIKWVNDQNDQEDEDDMNAQELALALGAEFDPFTGRVGLRSSTDGQFYPLAAYLEFTHAEIKRPELLTARLITAMKQQLPSGQGGVGISITDLEAACRRAVVAALKSTT